MNGTFLIAQAMLGGNLVYWLKIIVIVAALIAIVVVAVRAMGIVIPGWAVQMFWIVVIALVALLAIGLILQLI